jgi:septal ring factor EnvC (AmiA/AmiB activator)
MKTTKNTISILLLTVFGFISANSVQAESSNTPMIDPDCIGSLEVCQERAAEKEAIRQQCAADPVWCEKRRKSLRQQQREKEDLREQRKALRKQCKANPDQCKELKRQFKEKQKQSKRQQRKREARQKLKEAQKQWCTNNPSDCERWKEEKKVLSKQIQEMRRQLEKKYPGKPQSN